MANTNTNTNMNDVDSRLKALQLAVLEKQLAEAAESEEKEKILNERRAANAKQEAMFAKEAMEAKAYKQSRCPHMQKDTSHVRGQRLGIAKDKDGKTFAGFLAFCQICFKEYKSWEEIPEHLRGDPEYYGGPRNY